MASLPYDPSVGHGIKSYLKTPHVKIAPEPTKERDRYLLLVLWVLNYFGRPFE
jgi:hypothetical protein